MTETARDLRSAAHALEEGVTALRALSDDLNEPDPELEEVVTALRALSDDLNEPDPEPTPAWPTAPLVWWDGKVWVRGDDKEYQTAGNYWAKRHLDGVIAAVRDGARRFAREAISVTPVPTKAWEEWERASRDLDYAPDCELVDAVESLAQEVAR